MQNKNQVFYEKRILLYFGSLTRNQIKDAEDYGIIKDIIIINILNETRFKNVNKFHTIWSLREEDYKDLKLSGIEIHFIELDKFRRSKPDLEDRLNQWLSFIDSENKEMEEKATQKGIRKGKEEEMKKIVSQMLIEKIDINTISRVTGMKINKIKELKLQNV